MNERDKKQLKLLVDMFTRNAFAGVQYISGRALSLAELGVLREQARWMTHAAFLRGKLARQRLIEEHTNPWDPDNDPTTPKGTPDEAKTDGPVDDDERFDPTGLRRLIRGRKPSS